MEHFRYLLVASQLLDECLGQINPTSILPSHMPSTDGAFDRGFTTVNASFEGALSCTVLVLALAWLLHRIRELLNQKGATNSIFIVLIVCAAVALVGWAYVHTRWLCTIRQRTIDVASMFVTNLRAFEASTSNALVYIQEVELVSRGYQMYLILILQIKVVADLEPEVARCHLSRVWTTSRQYGDALHYVNAFGQVTLRSCRPFWLHMILYARWRRVVMTLTNTSRSMTSSMQTLPKQD